LHADSSSRARMQAPASQERRALSQPLSRNNALMESDRCLVPADARPVAPLAAALLAGLARPGAGRGRTLTVGYPMDF